MRSRWTLTATSGRIWRATSFSIAQGRPLDRLTLARHRLGGARSGASGKRSSRAKGTASSRVLHRDPSSRIGTASPRVCGGGPRLLRRQGRIQHRAGDPERLPRRALEDRGPGQDCRNGNPACAQPGGPTRGQRAPARAGSLSDRRARLSSANDTSPGTWTAALPWR